MPEVLNENYSFHDVRYQVNRRISYDVELSFVGDPAKVRLPVGTCLARLDFQHTFLSGVFTKVWWMHAKVFYDLLENAETAAQLRSQWQQGQAMPKSSKGLRTLIIEIQLTAPVYAWIGKAAPLFNKSGGFEQIYLPNLARGAGLNRSDYARLLRTYLLPA